MLKKIGALCLSLIACVCSANTAVNRPGFYVEGRFLKDKNGDTIILKGLNYTAVWMDPQGTKFAEMAKTGANSIRIVWEASGSAVALDTLITRCIRNGMIPIPEVHDLTGKPVSDLSIPRKYWTRSDVKKVLIKHQEYLILNFANEVGGDATDSAVFVNSYAAAVDSIRAHGINVPIMIDADQWGQNIDQLQRSAAPLLAKDPNHNLLFSIHMWWPYEYHSTSTGYASPGKRIIGEIKESVEKNIPLVIGEFSKISPSCKSSIPYDTLIEEATKNKIGWLAWAWMHGNNDGNGNNCLDMDMTDDGDFATLHDGTTRDKWAKDVTISSPFSIKNTAVRPKWIVDGDYSTGTIATPAGEELLVNGAFAEDLSGWTQGFWGGKATASLSDGMAKIHITDPGINAWDLQFSQGVAISEGKTYVLTFDAKADAAMSIQVLVKNSSPYKGYLDKAVALSTEVKPFKFEFNPDEDNAAAVLGFQLGAIRAGDVYLDNLSLKENASTSIRTRVGAASQLGLRTVANGFEWTRTAPLASAATVRVVDTNGRELFRTTAKAGTVSGFVPSVGSGLRFVVLESSADRDVRSLTSTR